MPRTITFNELRRIKSQLPEGSIHEIADKLQLTPQSVRNYFGGSNYLDMALDILNRSRKPAGE